VEKSGFSFRAKKARNSTMPFSLLELAEKVN